MCGIVGYIGDQQAAPILLAGLAKLEYRGYDSAGISVRNETNGEIEVVKAKGRLKTLIEKTDEGHSVYGSCGIGHTRWAHTVSHLRQMRIRIVPKGKMSCWYTMELLRISRN